jgi:hypothetical protein
MQASKMNTGYYGADGSIAPVFSFGRVPLAPSFLTGDGSHMGLWVSVVIHVAALTLTITANSLFFANSGSTASHISIGWAVASLTMFSLGVVGTVVSTALVRDVFAMPLLNTLGIGLFFGAVLATAKIAYLHGATFPSDSGEVVTYNLALFFQAFAVSSIIANSMCAVSKKGGI